jgi:hypothetical protein
MKVFTSLLGITLALALGTPALAGQFASAPHGQPLLSQVPPQDDPDSVDGEDPVAPEVDPDGPGVPPLGDDSGS